MTKHIPSILAAAIFIALIIIAIEINSMSENSLSSSDVDLVIDGIVESGVAYKSIDKDDPLLMERKIVISSRVNEAMADEVAKKLLYLDSVSQDSIFIYISTNGGWGYCAKLVMETMRIIKSPVNTVAMGTCCSSGLLMSVSATGKRYATKNTIFMLHANLDDEAFDDNKYYNKWYEGVFKEYTKVPSDWYPMTSDAELYFNVEEAIRYKVVDEVVE